MTTFTTGQAVRLDYHGQSVEATVELASTNGRSLLLVFDGALYAPSGGMMIGSIPLLMEDGVYRDLAEGDIATVTLL